MTAATMTKQAAARRLIEGAARMSAVGEDAVAVHVVAASALNLLRELLAQRGPGLVEQLMQAGIYQTALLRMQGGQVPEHPEFERQLDLIIEAIEAGIVTEPADINLLMGPHSERGLLDPMLRPFNFLKHAQKDPLATLNEADVKPVEALNLAIVAYMMLFPGEGMSQPVRAFLAAHTTRTP